MFNCRICVAGHTSAMPMVLAQLKLRGFSVTQAASGDATHLLLPVPAFDPDGKVRGGGAVEELLSCLREDVTVIGGNLQHPALDGYSRVDLLEDPFFVAQNANITAHCALRMILHALPCIPERCPMLVIGWGRIGKCLARLLRQVGAKVTVAARKASDRAMLSALGYSSLDTVGLDPIGFRVIVNTVPQMMLQDCDTDAYLLDLASKPGLSGDSVVWARGLPAKLAPESTAHLIAHTVTRILTDREVPL